jgi:hypothetical protein
VPDPDQAWKALSLVNDWLRHAETKLAATLAATGVSGGVLFNLVKNHDHGSVLFNISAATCFAGVIVAGTFALVGLFPRVQLSRPQETKDEPINPLFFHDIARAFKGDAPSYSAILHTLTTTPDDLVRHISQQVHANSTVAQLKYRWANWAIRALLLGLVGLAVLVWTISLKLW